MVWSGAPAYGTEARGAGGCAGGAVVLVTRWRWLGGGPVTRWLVRAGAAGGAVGRRFSGDAVAPVRLLEASGGCMFAFQPIPREHTAGYCRKNDCKFAPPSL